MSKIYEVEDFIADITVLRDISAGWGVFSKTPYHFDGLAVPEEYLPTIRRVETNYHRLLVELLAPKNTKIHTALNIALRAAGFEYEIWGSCKDNIHLKINMGVLYAFV